MAISRISVSRADIDSGLRAHLLNVFGLVALGLAISAATAYAVANTVLHDVFLTVNLNGTTSYTALGGATILVTFAALLFAAVGRNRGMPVVLMHAIYWLFTSSLGVTLSVMLVDKHLDLVHPLLATVCAFSGLCLFGYTTNRDLSGVGSFCTMGLFGLVAAAIFGMFTGIHMPTLLESMLGVVVFTGLTAYDTQKIKANYLASRDGSTSVAVWDAMGLYLDAMNLFLRLTNIWNSRD